MRPGKEQGLPRKRSRKLLSSTTLISSIRGLVRRGSSLRLLLLLPLQLHRQLRLHLHLHLPLHLKLQLHLRREAKRSQRCTSNREAATSTGGRGNPDISATRSPCSRDARTIRP